MDLKTVPLPATPRPDIFSAMMNAHLEFPTVGRTLDLGESYSLRARTGYAIDRIDGAGLGALVFTITDALAAMK